MISRRWFRPVRWKTFVRDFIVIQAGFALFGLAIAMLINANLGTSPWVVLNVALSRLTGLTVGSFIVIVGVVVLAIVLALKEPIGWGTLGNILFIGPWVDLWLARIPSLQGQPVLQSAMLLAAVLVMGLASAIYIGVDAGAGPRDSLMLAVERVSGWSLRAARSAIELTVFSAGWLLGGPAGIGTLVFALLIGPSVQLFFRLLRVQSHIRH
jgi:uncharacterized membrane protein YczE